MIRRVALFLVVAFCAVGGFSVYKWYNNRQTPQYATDQFIKALAAGPEKSYAWLSKGLQDNRQSYWQKYLADFTGETGSIIPAGGSSLEDRFNTYSDAEKPYRSLYAFDLNGHEYLLTIVVIHQDKTWKVDELHGSYRAQ